MPISSARFSARALRKQSGTLSSTVAVFGSAPRFTPVTSAWNVPQAGSGAGVDSAGTGVVSPPARRIAVASLDASREH